MKHETYFPDTMNHHDSIPLFFVLCFVFPTLVLPTSNLSMSSSFDPFVRYNNTLINVNQIVTIEVTKLNSNWTVLMSLSAAPKTIRWRILCDDGTDEQQRKSAENILDDLTLLIRERYRTVEFKLNPNEYLAAVE